MLATQRSPSSIQNRNRGFTIVELLIVISVLGILAALVIPHMGQASTVQLISAAKMLVGDIQYAQTQSIQRTGDDLAGILFFEDGTGYQLGYIDDNIATAMINPITQKGYIVRYGQGSEHAFNQVSIINTQLNDEPYLSFDRFGGINQETAQDVNIELASGAARITISISAQSSAISISTLQ